MKRLFRVAILLFIPCLCWGSITSQVDKTGPFLISGLPQTIPVGFVFQQGSDLLVLDTGPTGTPYDPAHVLVLSSDYTVTGGGYNGANQMQTGSVVVVGTGGQAVAVNDYIVIMRAVPINQTVSFTPSGPNTMALIEQALDKTATLSQQVNELGSRALQLENFEFPNSSGPQPILNKVARAGAVLGFDSNSNPIYVPVPGATTGIPSGGTTGQILTKTSNANYATGWQTGSTGGAQISGTPTNGQVGIWASGTAIGGQTLSTWNPTLTGISLSEAGTSVILNLTDSSANQTFGFAPVGSTLELVDVTRGAVDQSWGPTGQPGFPYFNAAGVLYAGATGLLSSTPGTTTTVLHGNASGAPSYGAVALATDVSGNLAPSHLNSGTSASGSTFWRGDGVWATPSGSGSVTGPMTSTTNGIATYADTSGSILLSPSAVTIASSHIITSDSTDQSGANTGSFQSAGGGYFAKSLLLGTSLTTGAPASGTAAAWKFGIFGTGEEQIDIAGTKYLVPGFTSYTTGDILYAGGSNTLAKLGIGSSGNVLSVSGGVPVWSAAGSGTVSTSGSPANTYLSYFTGSAVISGNSGASEDTSGNVTVNSLTLGSTTGIVGTTTNNNAATGSVGEYIPATLASGSAVTLTAASTSNITSISLTAGDWDVTGSAVFQWNATATYYFWASFSTVNGVSMGSIGNPDNEIQSIQPPGAATANDYGIHIGPTRYSLSGTTTIYLNANSNFLGGTANAVFGNIHARRVR